MLDLSNSLKDLMAPTSTILVDDMITVPELNRCKPCTAAPVKTIDPNKAQEARRERRLRRSKTKSVDADSVGIKVDSNHTSNDDVVADKNAQSSEPGTGSSPSTKKRQNKKRKPPPKEKRSAKPRHDFFYNAHMDTPGTDDDEQLPEFSGKRERSESVSEESQLPKISESTGQRVADEERDATVYSPEPFEQEKGEGDGRSIALTNKSAHAVPERSLQPSGPNRRKKRQASTVAETQSTIRTPFHASSSSVRATSNKGIALSLEKFENNDPRLPNRVHMAPMRANVGPALIATNDFLDHDQFQDPSLDEKASDMLICLISLACQPNEWIDYLGPIDYEISSGEATVNSAGHKNVASFMRAALYKIDDEPSRTYVQRNIDYQNVSVILRAHNVPRPTRVPDVWQPFSDVHEISRKTYTSVAHYVPELRNLWKSIVERTPHLALALDSDSPIAVPSPRRISFVLLLIVTCAPEPELQAALSELAFHGDHLTAFEDCVSEGLKGLRHAHPRYKNVGTSELTAIWTRLRSMLHAGSQGHIHSGGDSNTRTPARQSQLVCETQQGITSHLQHRKKRKADELEMGGVEMDAAMKPVYEI